RVPRASPGRPSSRDRGPGGSCPSFRSRGWRCPVFPWLSQRSYLRILTYCLLSSDRRAPFALGVEGRPEGAKVLDGRRAGHHHDHLARPCVDVAPECPRARGGRPGDEVALKRLGGDPVELRQPCGTAGGGAFVVAHADEPDD